MNTIFWVKTTYSGPFLRSALSHFCSQLLPAALPLTHSRYHSASHWRRVSVREAHSSPLIHYSHSLLAEVEVLQKNTVNRDVLMWELIPKWYQKYRCFSIDSHNTNHWALNCGHCGLRDFFSLLYNGHSNSWFLVCLPSKLKEELNRKAATEWSLTSDRGQF